MDTDALVDKIVKNVLSEAHLGMSREQERFLMENKGLLFEYYVQVSNPRGDSKILGNLQVWVYGDDRKKFTPHCHVMTMDKSVEFEVSLIDFSILIVKNGKVNSTMVDRFFTWLNSYSTSFKVMTNKRVLLQQWDATNPNNTVFDFIMEKGIETDDETINDYLNDVSSLMQG